jgi:hypothetical protein
VKSCTAISAGVGSEHALQRHVQSMDAAVRDDQCSDLEIL